MTITTTTGRFRPPLGFILLNLAGTLIFTLGIFILVSGQPAFLPKSLHLENQAVTIIIIGIVIMALDTVYFLHSFSAWKKGKAGITTVDRVPR